MPPLYLVLKTHFTDNTKPTYEVDDIVPHNYPSSLPHPRTALSPRHSRSPTSDPFTAYTFHTARSIPHTSIPSGASEDFDITLRWPYRYGSTSRVSVEGSCNEKSEASRLLDGAVTLWREAGEGGEEKGRKISSRFDGEGDLVFVRVDFTEDGAGVCFEVFCVDKVGPGRVFGGTGVKGYFA